MAELKTQQNDVNVLDFINSLENDVKKQDCLKLLEIFKEYTNQNPVMWGTSIIGFGSYHYKYESGREGDAPKLGFAARKHAMALYGLIFYDKLHENNKLLDELGPHKTGKACLYIKSLADVNVAVLKKMIKNSYNT